MSKSYQLSSLLFIYPDDFWSTFFSLVFEGSCSNNLNYSETTEIHMDPPSK